MGLVRKPTTTECGENSKAVRQDPVDRPSVDAAERCDRCFSSKHLEEIAASYVPYIEILQLQDPKIEILMQDIEQEIRSFSTINYLGML